MKKKSLFKILFSGLGLGILSVLITFNACNRDDLEVEKLENDQNHFSQQDGDIIKLGKKLENPYTVENMKKAYETLRGKEQLKSSMSIETTHYYVRFLPDGEEQLTLLLSDSLELFDYPLDYEIEGGGVFYQDPSIPDSLITWKYTAVPFDYEFPDVKYEKLANLYMQEENDDLTEVKNSSVSFNDWATLEDEALKITGNFEEEDDTETKSTLKGRKWRPSGTIKVNDTYMGDIPLEGVRVVIKKWFKWDHRITNKYGKFTAKRFRAKRIKYGIKWQRADFDIRSGTYGQAWYNFVKSKKRGAWNLTIKKSSTPKSWLYAHIHRAAHTYFYRNTFGIKTPHSDKWYTRKTKIGAYDKYDKSFMQNTWAIWPNVKIYSGYKNDFGRNIKYSSAELYKNTIHELAHVSHWNMGRNDFKFTRDIVAESWAVGVAYVISEKLYGSNIHNWQDVPIWKIITEHNKIYTPLVIDLIDTENQRVTENNNKNYPIDRVSGYTLSQIEDALKGAKTLKEWRDNIKDEYYNSTKKYVDELFENYMNL